MKKHMFPKRAPAEMETCSNLRRAIPLAVSRRHLYSAYAVGVYVGNTDRPESNVLKSSSCLPMIGGQISSEVNGDKEPIDLGNGISIGYANSTVMGHEDRNVYFTSAHALVTDLRIWDGYVNLKTIDATVTSKSDGLEEDLEIPAYLTLDLEIGGDSKSGGDPIQIPIRLDPDLTGPNASLSSKGAIRTRFLEDLSLRESWRDRFMPGAPQVHFEQYLANRIPPEIYGYVYFSLVKKIEVKGALSNVERVGCNILEIHHPKNLEMMRLYLGETMRSERTCRLFGVRAEIFGIPDKGGNPPLKAVVEAGTVGSNGMGSKPGGGYIAP